VSNHTSWLDVPVLGTLLPSVFVAKEDIQHWPIMGLVSKIGRTIFVSRQRSTTGHERDFMLKRMALGDNLVLFPEGTSSDGSRVLPFMSAFFSIAKLSIPKTKLSSLSTHEVPSSLPEITPLIQPVSVVYDRLDGLPIGRLRRPVFSWYGNMDLGPHVWQLLQKRESRATVILHSPLDPDLFPSRKALAQATWASIVKGTAELRQNHPPHIQPGQFHATTLPMAFLPAYARKFDSFLEKIFTFLFISSRNSHDD
ncbi:MAG: 1-acyl-sn-glycerol-3-phosphate acyltransferase, partial [Acetobacter sp.]|nr:1-acyl-sn-glycerol-3-phosphate acyltransferase [Acetobacter sp.]